MRPYVSLLMLPARLEWPHLNGLHKNVKDALVLGARLVKRENWSSQSVLDSANTFMLC